MLIECVNIDTGIFFIWWYEDMRLDEAREENGFTNILMLKSYSGLGMRDWINRKKKFNKAIIKKYKILDEKYIVPNHIENEYELMRMI